MAGILYTGISFFFAGPNGGKQPDTNLLCINRIKQNTCVIP